MARRATLLCPSCGAPFEAWFQSATRSVGCPMCRTDVPIHVLEIVEPMPIQRRWNWAALGCVLFGHQPAGSAE